MHGMLHNPICRLLLHCHLNLLVGSTSDIPHQGHTKRKARLLLFGHSKSLACMRVWRPSSVWRDDAKRDTSTNRCGSSLTVWRQARQQDVSQPSLQTHVKVSSVQGVRIAVNGASRTYHSQAFKQTRQNATLATKADSSATLTTKRLYS